jgi:hypothetical protein
VPQQTLSETDTPNGWRTKLDAMFSELFSTLGASGLPQAIPRTHSLANGLPEINANFAALYAAAPSAGTRRVINATDTVEVGQQKMNANFGELYAAGIAKPTFVGRSGSNLVYGGAVIKLTGYAHYNLLGDSSNYQCGPWMASHADRVERVRKMKAAGADIIRFHSWQAYFTTNAQGTGPYHRNWQPFDDLIQIAREFNVFLMPVLEGPWHSCQVPAHDYLYADWYESGYKTDASKYGVYPENYKEFCQSLVRRYKDEPRIFSWTLVGEAEAKNRDGTPNPQALYNFTVDMVNTIKAIDPNHLLTLGVIGGPQAGVEGDNYERLHAINGIDYCEVHDYGFHDEPLPGAPYAPNVPNIMYAFGDGGATWRSGGWIDAKSRTWQTVSYSIPHAAAVTRCGPGFDPKSPITAITGPIYIDSVTIDGTTYDFEDSTLQGFECSSRFSLSNEARPGGGGRALKVSVLSGGGGGQVWRNQSGTNVSYTVYTDVSGTVRHVNTVASAHAIANYGHPWQSTALGLPGGATARFKTMGSQTSQPCVQVFLGEPGQERRSPYARCGSKLSITRGGLLTSTLAPSSLDSSVWSMTGSKFKGASPSMVRPEALRQRGPAHRHNRRVPRHRHKVLYRYFRRH